MISKILSLALVVGGLSFGTGNVNAASSAGLENKCKAKTLKADNRIQEDGQGYVAVLKKDKETQACVKSINAKRRAKYQSIAKKDNIPVDTVEKIAAEKLK